MKRIMAMLMSVVLTLGLTACGHTVGDVDLEAGQRAISIQLDGLVSYAVSESFDKDYYDKDELKKEIEAEIKAYNASSDASVDDAITLDSFSVSKKVATLSLDFTTTYDLLNYMLNDNRVEKDKFYIGTIDSNDDCKISGNFVEPGKKDKIKAKTIKSMTDSNILIVDEQYKVQVEGNVLYTSDNCKIDDDGIVTTAKSDDELSYIVYELE